MTMMIAFLLGAAFAEDVFVSGALQPGDRYAIYRIPAILNTRRETLLALAEGRETAGDQSANDIVLRRRERGGSWGKLQVLADFGKDSLNNPTLVQDDRGRIWLMFQQYPAGNSEYRVPTGRTGEGISRTYVIWSDDDGVSWSKPRDLTFELKPGWARTIASGPGVGIQLQHGRHKGRLLFPFNMGDASGWRVFAAISDDRGQTWRMGDLCPRLEGTNPNEVQFVELADGRVMMNARNQAAVRQRLVGYSSDGGDTWTTPMPDPNLIDPVCMGAIIRVGGALAFSNPADTQRRVNGVLRFSFDEGKSWPKTLPIDPGAFAYSVLCPLPGGRIGCLYEAPEKGGYRIKYVEFDVPKG